MTAKISHSGMFAGELVATYELDDSLKVGVHEQHLFQHFNKIVSRGTQQGTVILGGTKLPMGVISDLSPQGDTVAVDTAGYVWVVADLTGLAYGKLVTCAVGGTLVSTADPENATEAEKHAGCWQVDEINEATSQVLIMIDCYL